MISNVALLEAVGPALSWMLTYLIHSTILILSVWLLCRAIKPISRRIGPGGENVAWKLAIVGGFVTATIQVAAGVTPALGALEFSTAPALAAEASAPAAESAAATQGGQPIVIRMQRSDEPMMLRAGAPSVGIAPLAPVAPVLASQPAVERDLTPAAPVWPLIVLAVWGLGTLLATGRLLMSVRGLRRRLSDREEVLVDPVLETFLTLCRDAEIKRKIRLTRSQGIESPIALWRREIVLPQRAVDTLSPPAMRSVLAHELAHLERRDPHWLAFAAVLEVVCFFQPLNRLARRGMQDSAELLCDDWAIAHTGDAVQFAKSLAELASWNQAGRSSLLVAGMLSGDRPLVQRVRRALDGDPRRFGREEGPRPTRMLFGLGALAALIMVAPGAVDASSPKDEAKADEKAKSKESKAERKARKAREKAEREAAKAEAKARAAQLEAEKAQREAEQAMREAERARREAEARLGAPPVGDGRAQGSEHLVIRDGENYVIIDGRGVQLHGEGAEIMIIDGENPRMQMRIHDGQTDLDLNVDLDTLEGLAEGLIGGLIGEELGHEMGAWPFEVGEMAEVQRELQGMERELLEELEREGFGNFDFDFDFDVDPEAEVDFDRLEREAERAAREADRQLRELRERRREIEARGHHRHQHPSPPPRPIAPQAAPPAPPAPAPAPLVAI